MAQVFLCPNLSQAEGLNEGIWHKNRIAQQFGFLSKAPLSAAADHSDCEARLDIPVPATKKKSAVTKVTALFLFYLALKLFLALVFALFFQSEKQNESEEEHEKVWLFLFYLALTLFLALGQHGSSVLNIDLKTGNQIKLKDVLVDNYKSALKALGKRKFLEQNGNDVWWFSTEDDQPFELPEVFSITRKGITFTYQHYEIGPYAAGAPEVFLSIKDLGPLLKANAYLK